MYVKSPIVIIGAGRSGTNALRNALCSLDGLSTWPCDEINYIWRHGNRDHPTDELRAEHATPEVVNFIRGAFTRRVSAAGGDRIVEKTCANSLRVGFVDAVLDEPFFVQIVRDGRDAVSSAMDRWTAELDIPYLARKARYVPPGDLVHYALSYAKTRIVRRNNNEHRLGWWGPKIEGMDELRTDGSSLARVAAMQWAACVNRAAEQLRDVPGDRQISVRYEDFVEDPTIVLTAILEASGHSSDVEAIAAAASAIRSGSVGGYRRRLNEAQIAEVESIVLPVMESL